MDASADGVSVSVEGELATVTLDRPDRLNAQTPRMWWALRAVGSALPGSVRVVLVRGAGRSFSAGLDRTAFSSRPAADGELSLAELAAMSPEAGQARIADYQAAFGWLARPDLISVALVQGHAVGAGFQLALACDLRVLADDAQLTMAEVPLGLVPDLGGTRRLVALVGYARALEICLTARPVPATEALRLGLANRVVPRAELDDAAHEMVAAVLKSPRSAVIEVKSLLEQAQAHSQEQQERAERAAQHRLLRERAGFADG